MTPTRQLLGRDLPPLFTTPDLPGAQIPAAQGHWCMGAAETMAEERADRLSEHLPAERTPRPPAAAEHTAQPVHPRAPTCTAGVRRPALSGHSLAEE
ncbi:hypothetical protein EDD93_2649 [Streptomyces sp. 840.1]|uniref:hypothetical protein n=1 Tax=Streptomyces sp. 840.1 TaxID=2485152 RepID=UPI000FA9C12F|nr:hypothetical protein [Streptomyces sp. 840.1]ROQ68193.1 hypothetical protein EDD93_2649 [Streptomyces sp. 840.1]